MVAADYTSMTDLYCDESHETVMRIRAHGP